MSSVGAKHVDWRNKHYAPTELGRFVVATVFYKHFVPTGRGMSVSAESSVDINCNSFTRRMFSDISSPLFHLLPGVQILRVPESEAKSESTKALEAKREPREPRALSTEYHKARKQLMLWAGILFIWELIGIDLERAKEAGGNAGALIRAIKSPQAIPWALLILIAYFLFKVSVEWFQCSVARRRLRVSRIDFTSAWVVTVIAYALYVAQVISRVQIADILVVSGWSPFLGAATGVALAGSFDVIFFARNFDWSDWGGWLSFLLGLLFLGTLVLGSRVLAGQIHWYIYSVFLITGMFLELAVFHRRRLWALLKTTTLLRK